MSILYSARTVEPNCIDDYTCIEPGTIHYNKINDFAYNTNSTGIWGQHSGLSPELFDTIYDLIIVVSPPTKPESNLLFSTLSLDGKLIIIGSENPAYDYLKSLFFDYGNLGSSVETNSPQIWWGGRTCLSNFPQESLKEQLPTIVSFYTINTPYEDLAEKFKKNCIDLCLTSELYGVKSTGRWESNCALKADIIKQTREKVEGPLLWIDIDAVIHKPPSILAATDSDFAIHKCDGWQFASGTIFFNDTELARLLIDNWVKRCQSEPTTWDQVHLDLAWEEISISHALHTLWLPQSYTYIFDKPPIIGEKQSPVIEHFQASRKFKRIVSGGLVGETPKDDPEIVNARKNCRPRSNSFLHIKNHSDLEQQLPTIDLFIAGMSRSGSTMLANLLTHPPHYWILIEPGITRDDMGEHVRLQANHFGLSISQADWDAFPGESAIDRFKRLIGPHLNQSKIKWGIKEVNAIGWREIYKIAKPRQTILIVRDLRDVAISAIEKQQRNPVEGQDEQWLLERIISSGSAQVELALTLNEKQGYILKYEEFLSSEIERNNLYQWLNQWPISGNVSQRMDLYKRNDETRKHGGRITCKSIGRYMNETDSRRKKFALTVNELMSTYQSFFGYI